MTPGNATATIERIQKHPHLVVHPLFDEPEEKLRPDHLPPMPMRRSAKGSLMTLRAYLMLMLVMFGYHFLDLAGFLGHHAK